MLRTVTRTYPAVKHQRAQRSNRERTTEDTEVAENEERDGAIPERLCRGSMVPQSSVSSVAFVVQLPLHLPVLHLS